MSRAAATHLHKRKRIHKYKEPYPNPDPRIALLDKIVLYMAIIYPLSTLPQVVKIFTEGSAEGISVLTWSLYFVFGLPFLAYSFVHKAKPLIVNYMLWEVMYLLVIIGVLLH